jgi:hypothetical protein
MHKREEAGTRKYRRERDKNRKEREIEKGECEVKGSSGCVWNLNANLNTGTHTSRTASLATTYQSMWRGKGERNKRCHKF